MFRKLLNVFDEHQSRENAKHVHRAMCENARQGFWNGSHPPFGYKTQIAERRGDKDKKVLVIDEEEACVVREIFALRGGSRRTTVRGEGDRVPFDRARDLPAGRPVLDRQRLRDPHLLDILRSTLLQPAGQSDRSAPPALAVGRVPGSGDHRRSDLQRGPGAPAEPEPETDAAARRERPDLPRRNCPLWLLRRRHDPEHRQGRALPLLLLLAQAEGGRVGLPRVAHADGEAGRDRGRRGCSACSSPTG